MFTGIVADVGKVISQKQGAAGTRMEIGTGLDVTDFTLGESIAVNGVCLTVDAVGRGSFSADVSPETLKKSNLGDLRTGDRVNLERALRPIDRLGGHFVLGHVDGRGRIISRRREGAFEVITLDAPPEVERYLVAKGSVAVDGVSLTVAGLVSGGFTVAVIPHTLEKTTLSGKRAGESINLEADILGKYVEKLTGGAKEGGLTMEKLASLGFVR